MGVGETITVINKSGKVVSSSKHIVNVFKDAKAAYRERKAEIKAERDAANHARRLSEGVARLRITDDDDTRSRASSRHSHRSSRSKSHRHASHRDRPPLDRGYSDAPPPPRHRFEADLAGRDAPRMELARRNTDIPLTHHHSSRRHSEPDIDMDLAYGDVPPPLPSPSPARGAHDVREKASKIELLLDEANCLQHSVTATIENLQKNPDALAAVSLTLAELSALVTKLGPGVLVSLKASFPAVAALLLSPQFLIAGGVAVGVTIVALGGYKIVKRITADSQPTSPLAGSPMAMPAYSPASPRDVDSGPAQLDEIAPSELSRVEIWRRGIADAEAADPGSTVEVELVTPGASKHLVAAGVLREDDLMSRRSGRTRREGGEERPRTHRAKSERSVKTSKTSGEKKSRSGGKEGATVRRKEKEPSGLKMLFRSATAL